jgi:hypothetical protein
MRLAAVKRGVDPVLSNSHRQRAPKRLVRLRRTQAGSQRSIVMLTQTTLGPNRSNALQLGSPNWNAVTTPRFERRES